MDFRCRNQDIQITRTRKDFLKLFLAKLPETYYLNGRVQSEGNKHRSFSDLLTITKDRFPKTSLKNVIGIIARLNKEGYCDIVWCKQVNRFVVRGQKNRPGLNFITSFSTEYFKDAVGEDDISYKQLIRIRKEENVK